jgi:hypothetical protein
MLEVRSLTSRFYSIWVRNGMFSLPFSFKDSYSQYWVTNKERQLVSFAESLKVAN